MDCPYGIWFLHVSLWSFIVLHGPIRSHTFSYCPIQSCMVSYGPLWFHMVLYGLLWSFMNRMVLYGPVETVWSCRVSYSIVWSRIAPYGVVWPCSVLNRLAWSHLAHLEHSVFPCVTYVCLFFNTRNFSINSLIKHIDLRIGSVQTAPGDLEHLK